MLNKERVLSRATIEKSYRNWDEELSSGALDVHIYNLRQKLGKSILFVLYMA